MSSSFSNNAWEFAENDEFGSNTFINPGLSPDPPRPGLDFQPEVIEAEVQDLSSDWATGITEQMLRFQTGWQQAIEGFEHEQGWASDININLQRLLGLDETPAFTNVNDPVPAGQMANLLETFGDVSGSLAGVVPEGFTSQQAYDAMQLMVPWLISLEQGGNESLAGVTEFFEPYMGPQLESVDTSGGLEGSFTSATPLSWAQVGEPGAAVNPNVIISDRHRQAAREFAIAVAFGDLAKISKLERGQAVTQGEALRDFLNVAPPIGDRQSRLSQFTGTGTGLASERAGSLRKETRSRPRRGTLLAQSEEDSLLGGSLLSSRGASNRRNRTGSLLY